MFQGFCNKLFRSQEHGSTWKHHPKPSPCGFLPQSLAWVSTCPWHNCPLSPPTAETPYGDLIPCPGKALQPQPCWLAASLLWWVSNKHFQSTALRTGTGGELEQEERFPEVTCLGWWQLGTRAEWREMFNRAPVDLKPWAILIYFFLSISISKTSTQWKKKKKRHCRTIYWVLS